MSLIQATIVRAAMLPVESPYVICLYLAGGPNHAKKSMGTNKSGWMPKRCEPLPLSKISYHAKQMLNGVRFYLHISINQAYQKIQCYGTSKTSLRQVTQLSSSIHVATSSAWSTMQIRTKGAIILQHNS